MRHRKILLLTFWPWSACLVGTKLPIDVLFLNKGFRVWASCNRYTWSLKGLTIIYRVTACCDNDANKRHFTSGINHTHWNSTPYLLTYLLTYLFLHVMVHSSAFRDTVSSLVSQWPTRVTSAVYRGAGYQREAALRRVLSGFHEKSHFPVTITAFFVLPCPPWRLTCTRLSWHCASLLPSNYSDEVDNLPVDSKLFYNVNRENLTQLVALNLR